MEFNDSSYCGIFCKNCEVLIATKEGKIKELAQKRNIDEEALKCYGCKSEKTTPWCSICTIKDCCKEKKLDSCYEQCEEYPCKKIAEHTNVPIVNKEKLLTKFFTMGLLHGNVQALNEALFYVKDVNIKNSNGETPLTIVSKLRPDLVKILIEKGAEVNLCDNNNISPLHWAVEYDNVEIIEYLLKNGAKTEIYDNLGETPLHWAAWTGHYKSAKILLEYGADKTVQNRGGVLPMDLAVRQGHKKVIELLK